ncbi:MAG: SHOCT domain-containing protein [Planctomycetes bacterium]|nr:SHOCT domain-containing protein [Planctomycetota bacterium]
MERDGRGEGRRQVHRRRRGGEQEEDDEEEEEDLTPSRASDEATKRSDQVTSSSLCRSGLSFLIPVLGASPQPGELFSELFPWLVVLIGVTIAGSILVSVLRRAMRGESGPVDDFTLQGLRDLRNRGLLSEDEFERARASMIERVRGATSENNDADGPENPAETPS